MKMLFNYIFGKTSMNNEPLITGKRKFEENSNITYLECNQGSSDTFYEMILDDANVSIRYGRNGTNGTKSVKSFSSCDEAEDFMTKTKFEKLAKGYEHISDHDIEVNNRKHQRNCDIDNDEVDFEIEISSKRSKYLENRINKTHKFYEIIVEDNTVTTKYGFCGTNGTTIVKSFHTEAEAVLCMSNSVRDKLNHGYKEVNIVNKTELFLGNYYNHYLFVFSYCSLNDSS